MNATPRLCPTCRCSERWSTSRPTTTRPATDEVIQVETYTAMRHFADSWGLVAMAAFFAGVVVFTLRPGSKQMAQEAADIPLKDD